MSNSDTVPGLGFKDKEKALETLKNLEGRDPDYQRLAVKGLVGRAKRTLQVTKAEEKVTNIKEAVEVFERWLRDFEVRPPGVNRAYLPLATVEAFSGWWAQLLVKAKENMPNNVEQMCAFIKAYRACDGDYKKLRTVESEEGEPTWDIVRNKRLKELLDKIDEDKTELWSKKDTDDEELPTLAHTELIMWAFSPDASRIKKRLPQLEQLLKEYNINDDTTSNANTSSDKNKSNGKSTKRKSDTTSDNKDEEELPEKKTKVTESKSKNTNSLDANCAGERSKSVSPGVPGLGFKDKEKALETLENLKGRDPSYQRLAVQGLVGRAKRTMEGTKSEEKISNIKKALVVFEHWLMDFDKKCQKTLVYLPIETVEVFVSWWKELTMKKNDHRPRGGDKPRPLHKDEEAFLTAYRACQGDHKKLRIAQPKVGQPTWDILRNKRLKELLLKIKDDADLWIEKGGELFPSLKHTELIMWAYSPDALKIKKKLPALQAKLQPSKTKNKIEVSDKNKEKRRISR